MPPPSFPLLLTLHSPEYMISNCFQTTVQSVRLIFAYSHLAQNAIVSRFGKAFHTKCIKLKLISLDFYNIPGTINHILFFTTMLLHLQEYFKSLLYKNRALIFYNLLLFMPLKLHLYLCSFTRCHYFTSQYITLLRKHCSLI